MTFLSKFYKEFTVDGREWSFSRQHRFNVLHAKTFKPIVSFHSDSADMRQQRHIFHLS
jgi:hypothetical protein